MIYPVQFCINWLCQPHSAGKTLRGYRKTIKKQLTTGHHSQYHPRWCSKISHFLSHCLWYVHQETPTVCLLVDEPLNFYTSNFTHLIPEGVFLSNLSRKTMFGLIWTETFAFGQNLVSQDIEAKSTDMSKPLLPKYLLITGIPPTDGYDFLLTCVDRFTRCPLLGSIADTSSEKVYKAFLNQWISTFGVWCFFCSNYHQKCTKPIENVHWFFNPDWI